MSNFLISNFCFFVVLSQIFDNIIYMRNVGNAGVLAKRYFNNKTIKEHFLNKRSYSSNCLNNQQIMDDITSYHKNGVMVSFEAKMSKNYILASALELQENTFVKVTTNNNGEIHYVITDETLKLVKSIDLLLKKMGYSFKKP